jgi:putative transposase
MYGKSLNKYQLQKHLTKLKKLDKYKFFKLVPSQAIQDITDRIDKAYKLFYRNQKQGIKSAPPTFQKIKKYKSYTLKQAGYKIENNIISLNGYKFKFWLSRPIDGKIKTITIKRDNVGDYYICISLEKEYSKISATSGKIVGIDFGLKTFLTLSDGTQIQAPRHYLKYLNKLKQLQKKLSKKIKNSNNYKLAKKQLAKLHQKVVNSRRDFFHKLANELAKKYQYIVIEDLNIKAMQKRWGKKISDYAFSEFVSILEYKTNLIKIDRYYPSTKTCSVCGYVNEKLNLNDREWICPKCNTKHDRDINASINICKVGASTFGIDGVRLAICQQPSL